MLVVTRRTGELVSIPSLGVSIRVVCTQGNRARIGIDAPVGVTIRRAELFNNAANDSDDRITFELCCQVD